MVWQIARSVIAGGTIIVGIMLLFAAWNAVFDMSASSLSEAAARIITAALGLCCIVSGYRT